MVYRFLGGVMGNQVGLFFYVNGRFLFQGVDLDMAEDYEDCLTYPESHYEVLYQKQERRIELHQ